MYLSKTSWYKNAHLVEKIRYEIEEMFSTKYFPFLFLFWNLKVLSKLTGFWLKYSKFMGPVRNNDMQTTLGAPLQKWPYWNKRCALGWTEWKNYFPIIAIFIFQDMVDLVLKILIFKYFYQNNWQKCNFLVSETFWNESRTDFKIFAIFSVWDMFDFVLKLPSELGT